MTPLSYLALGDSYTIGEGVVAEDRYPNHLVQLCKTKGWSGQVQIIAKTGWTTGELLQELEQHKPTTNFNLVTLLIGVNNQYRGLAINDFAAEFDRLLDNAIGYAADQPNHVIVLSIPDWGVTPFAKDRDITKIASEIDQFNSVVESRSQSRHCQFLDVTTNSRANSHRPGYLVEDGLHPSGLMYGDWANRLWPMVEPILTNKQFA